MTKVKIYSRYATPPQISFDTGIESKVDYSQREVVNINTIISRYMQTGDLPNNIRVNQPIYGDFTNNFTVNDVFTLKDNLQLLYSQLSPDVSSKFESFNDFCGFVSSCSDEELSTTFTKPVLDDTPNTVPVPSNPVLVTPSVSSEPVAQTT